ncbi:epimerase [Aeromonas diversa CDC 2478-85]|uniref:Epimerase n=1 Tax=Aeromonas diversa CDC 2478-85 TaxID=1268237 RepID=N9VKV6_9GAMM|nr:PhzF family phenazine biosynthesis protein [Aeromonas diversa]ENY72218.1 epimerase [Aeromonas diversa CDC 2478-85]
MNLTVYQVDAFSRTPFGGNPAAVCITDQGLTPALMQAIAAEMAVSETAFLALDTGRLRWFTPEVEVELCGHGTLSVGAVLREQGMLGEGEGKTFETLSGPLSVSVQGEWLALDFPEQPATPCEPDSALLAALCIERSRVQCYAMNGPKVMVVVDEPALVEALAPDHVALRRLPGRGVVVSAPSADPAFDFISRYFSPSGRVRGRPGHRLGPLHPGPLLGRATRAHPADGPSGLPPQRRAASGAKAQRAACHTGSGPCDPQRRAASAECSKLGERACATAFGLRGPGGPGSASHRGDTVTARA